MPRYIDAIKLLKEFQALPCCRNGYSDEYDKARIFAMIDNQPTADVVERKKGKWIDRGDYCVCNQCRHMEEEFTPFCAMCGADMREEKEDELQDLDEA